MFEEHCHKLDYTLFKLRVTHADDDKEEDPCINFDRRVTDEYTSQQNVATEIAQKKEELEQVEDEIPLCILKKDLPKQGKVFCEMANRAFVLRQQLKDLEKREIALPFGAGPIASSLDSVLQRHNVKRQAYHGKAFVGNHVHKCCQMQVIKDLTSEPSRILRAMDCEDIPVVSHQKLIREAAEMGSTFEDVFLKYADVHFAMNHAKALTGADLTRVDICIKSFMRSYRVHFPSASITPKMHLLEDHAVDQLTRFGVGFGLLNEQGGELIHKEFNRTGRVVNCMRDDLQRLMTVMKRHHLSTTPEIQARVQAHRPPKRQKVQ